LKDGIRTIEAIPEAEDAWWETMRANAVDRSKFLSDCTPGYFNDEGQTKGPMRRGFGGSPTLYMDMLQEWRAARLDQDLAVTFE
jgi:hypothetical protein